MGHYTGEIIESRKYPDLKLEVILVDGFLEECTCIEANSHDAKQYKVRFGEVMEG